MTTLQGGVCMLCRHLPLPYDSLRFLWDYSGNQRDVICFLKYSGKAPLAETLAQEILFHLDILFERIPEAFSPDYVLPLPISQTHLKKRQFHQLLPIADAVKKRLLGQRVSIQELQGLSYCGAGVAQASRPHQERIRRSSGDFQACPRRFKDRQVLLVEDVVTTGATLYNVCSALKHAGAKRVDVLALCRAANWYLSRQEVHKACKAA
jgi:predicted amidophosphoribosyltransferase